MKKFINTFILIMMAVCSAYAEDIVDSFSSMAKRVIDIENIEAMPRFAFVTLASDFEEQEINEYLTDALMESVYSTGKIKIVERSKLDKIISELELQNSGIIDDATAKQVGKLAGVDYIVYGNATDVENTFYIKVKVTDVQTGELCAIASDYILPDDYLNSLAKSSINSKKESEKQAKKEEAALKKEKNKNFMKFSVMYDVPLIEPYFGYGGISFFGETKLDFLLYGINAGFVFPVSAEKKELNYVYGCLEGGIYIGCFFLKGNVGYKFDMKNEDAINSFLIKGETGIDLFNFLRIEYNAVYIFEEQKFFQGVSAGISRKI